MLRQLNLDFDHLPLHLKQFSGSDFVPKFDYTRLKAQIKDIYELMKDKKWRTLKEISQATGHEKANCSAQLRNLRKENFGSHTIDKRPRGDRSQGLYEYALI